MGLLGVISQINFSVSRQHPILQQVQDERKNGNWFQDERMGRRRLPYRHSRLRGNPAVASQDCGIIRQYR